MEDIEGLVGRVEVPGGVIRYRDVGSGPVIVLAHGLVVNAGLWRHVVPHLVEAGYRCVVPDLPLGAHEIPVPDAELTPPGVAEMLGALLDELDLRDVTLIGNDTGGALVQLLMARKPERVGRYVLVACDAYERFLPPMFTPLAVLAKVPGFVSVLVASMRIRAMHRLPLAYGWLAKRPIPRDVVDSYLRPSRRSAGVRNGLRRFAAAVDRRFTLAAAEEFPSVTAPVLVVWAKDDRHFPLSLGERLVADLPNSSLKVVDDSYTLIPEDRPDELARMILEFLRVHAA